jgi:hypothetical protein
MLSFSLLLKMESEVDGREIAKLTARGGRDELDKDANDEDGRGNNGELASGDNV